jgi:acyl-CoA thioester hydrolase
VARTFDEKDATVQRFMPPVEARLRVIYGDTDQMGVVYYANYFRYFELSRSEYFRARGGSYTEVEKRGLMLPVVDAQCSYRAPARYDDVLLVRADVTRMKRASVEFTYEVRRDGEDAILCTGHTLHACVNREGRPTALPEDVVKLLAPRGD